MVRGQDSYSISKISREAVARFCPKPLNLPTVIARMGAAYRLRGSVPIWHLHAITGPCRANWHDGVQRMAEHFYPE